MRRLLPLLSLALVVAPISRADDQATDAGFRALSGSEAGAFIIRSGVPTAC